jgi:hypothetical protein
VNTFFLRLIEAKREQVLFAMPVPNIWLVLYFNIHVFSTYNFRSPLFTCNKYILNSVLANATLVCI